MPRGGRNEWSHFLFVNKLLSRSFTSLHRAVRRRAIRRRRVRRRQGTYHVVGGGGLFCEALLPLCNSISSKRPQIRSLMPSTILGTAIVFPTRACWRTVFSFYRRAAVKRLASIRHAKQDFDEDSYVLALNPRVFIKEEMVLQKKKMVFVQKPQVCTRER